MTQTQDIDQLFGPASSVLVTGASSGIGAALAQQIGRFGAHVALVARRADRLEEVAAKVRQAGGKPTCVVADVTNPADVAAAYAQIVATQGDVTVAILNAGIGLPEPLDRFRLATVRKTFEVNFFGVVHWLEHLLPGWRKAGRGVLVGVSSLAAHRGMPQQGAYCASKAALSTYLEALRVEGAEYGIQVTTVEPGFVKSELTAKNKFPMPFLMEADDAAALICERIARGDGLIRFPWPMSAAVSVLSGLPNGLFHWLGTNVISRQVRKGQKPRGATSRSEQP